MAMMIRGGIQVGALVTIGMADVYWELLKARDPAGIICTSLKGV